MILRKAILDYEEKIYEALYKDLKKSKTEAYITEIGFALSEISFHIKHLKSWMRVKKVKTNWTIFPLAKSYIYKEALGNVLIISPWNYPFGLSISPLIGAISAGNNIVLKPSEISSNTSLVIEEMIKKYFDKEYIRVVQGGPSETQELLKQNFDYIFFTGSEKVAKEIMKSASLNLCPLTLELGGKSPCIVDSEVDLEKTAKRIVFGKFINAGQTCIAPDYILVQKGVKAKLVEKMIEKIKDFYGEKPEESDDYGRIINDKHFDRLINYLADLKILYGGKTIKEKKFISPTLVERCENKLIMEEEIFGPILAILEYENIDEVIEYINSKGKPLAVYIFSKNKKFQKRIMKNTSSGGVCINDTILQVANHNLPFGGVQRSGFGKYHGKASFDTFSNTKSVLKNTLYFDISFRYPPFKSKVIKIMKKLLQ